MFFRMYLTNSEGQSREFLTLASDNFSELVEELSNCWLTIKNDDGEVVITRGLNAE